MSSSRWPLPGPWRIAMASSVGTSHLASGQDCEDAYDYRETVDADGQAVLVLAVADGAGTAARAKAGATLVCKTMTRLVADYLEKGGRIGAIGRPLAERWVLGLLYGLQLHMDRHGGTERDHACTLMVAMVGTRESAFLQIGDGAMVVAEASGWRHIFWPQHGEFANTTTFITSEGATKAMAFATSEAPIDEIALFTDGLENLVLHNASQTVHRPFFDRMFATIRRSTAIGVDVRLCRSLEDYLANPRINQRTDDDKTLILAARKRG